MVRDLFGVTPDPAQEEVLKAFPHNSRIAMKASKGVGKELCKNTLVPTPTGTRRFGDIRVGESVFAQDGSVTAVTAVFDNGIKPVWRVTFDDGSSVLAGAEHNWKVRGAAERMRKHAVAYRRETQTPEIWSVLTTAEIMARGVRVKNGRWGGRQFEIPLHGAADYPQVLLPLDPYLLGVWLGDGVRGEPCYFKPYREVEQEIQRRGYKTSRSGDRVRILDSTKNFRKVDGFGLHSFNRFVPLQFKQTSAQQRRDLVCGLLDTDGCVGSDGHIEFSTTSRQLGLDVVWLTRSLGGNAFVKDAIKKAFYRDDAGNKIKCKDCYRVTIRLPFNPFRIPHKAVRWKSPYQSNSTLRYMKRYIDSIEPAGSADCMCIEVVHPSHCYLVNDFIVTHNTTTESWLAWNFLLTRPHPKIAATSISADNLRDNLWTEMALWQNKSPLLKAAFQWNKERIVSKENPETWWMSARQWSKTADKNAQSATLAGLHADYIMFILDESGGMPDAIMASAEAALSSCKEGHIVQAGNPTHLEGPLYRACTQERRLWFVIEVSGDPDSPLRSPRVSVQWARDQIEKYGRDNPWVLVNVFGQFPPSSLNALIGPDEVRAAMKRSYREQEYSAQARILGVDVAREGDDSSVIFRRQGLQAFIPKQYRNIDGTQGAGIVAREWQDWDADACFIDDTGGFGSSWIDNLRRLGRSPIGVHFAQTGTDRYFNKRAEMAFECVQWVKDGGALPDIPELLAAMTQTTYTFKGDKLLIEPKDAIKIKLGYSPDHFDSLMLTFAFPVLRAQRSPFPVNSRHESDYDALSRDKALPSGHQSNYTYDPRR